MFYCTGPSKQSSDHDVQVEQNASKNSNSTQETDDRQVEAKITNVCINDNYCFMPLY